MCEGAAGRGSGREFVFGDVVVPSWGLPYRILHIKLVKPKKGTTMETIGMPVQYSSELDFATRPSPLARIGAAVGFCLYVMRVDLAFDPQSNL